MCRRDQGHFQSRDVPLWPPTSIQSLKDNFKAIREAVEAMFENFASVRMFHVRVRRHDPADSLWDVPDNQKFVLDLNPSKADESLVIFWLRVCDAPKIIVYPQGQERNVCDGSSTVL